MELATVHNKFATAEMILQQKVTTLNSTVQTLQSELTESAESHAIVHKGQAAEIHNLTESIARLNKVMAAKEQKIAQERDVSQMTLMKQEKILVAEKKAAVDAEKRCEASVLACQQAEEQRERVERELSEQQDATDEVVDGKDCEIAELRTALLKAREEKEASESFAQELMQERAEMEAAKDNELSTVAQEKNKLASQNEELLTLSETQAQQTAELERAMKEHMAKASAEQNIIKASQNQKVRALILV